MANLFLTCSQDARFYHDETTVWDDAHNDTSATSVTQAASTDASAAQSYTFMNVAVYPGTSRDVISRLTYLFDVSSITTAPATATFAIWISTVYSGNNGAAGSAVAVKGTGGVIGTDFVVGDYNNLDGWTSGFDGDDLTLYSSDTLTNGNMVVGGTYGAGNSNTSWYYGTTEFYNEDGENYVKFSLNAAALADIASLDTFQITLIEKDHDYDNLDHGGSFGMWTNLTLWNSADCCLYYNYPQNYRVPLLVYTEGSAGGTWTSSSRKLFNASAAGVKKIFGVASASVFKVMGR